MVSIEEKVENSIMSKPKGDILFADDFVSYGSSKAIQKALERLTNKGVIKRVARGIFVRPVISKYIGEVLPSAEEMAEGIAKRDRIKIVPTGSFALNKLGLSTQVPLNLVYLTDGSPREIQIGKRTITLKKAAPKNLLAKGEISSLAIQALKEVGQKGMNTDFEREIVNLLRKEKETVLRHDMLLAPVWIKRVMQKAL